MKRTIISAAILAAVPVIVLGGPAKAGYNVQTVTDPTGTNFINLLGINNAGTIAGFDNANIAQGFTLTLSPTRSFAAENFPGATSTMVTAINNHGDTAGIYTDVNNNTHGFTDINGGFRTVDDPASPVFNQALGINDSRTTVGYFAPTQAGTTGQVAYSQSNGVFTNINALLPSNFNSQAVGINNQGEIVGFYQPTDLTSVGFLDKSGVISTIDPFGSTFTQALGINNAGEIVGFYTDANDVQHGYVDNNGSFTTFDPSGSVGTTINGVNDLGQLAGFYTDANDDVVGFVATKVPEPAAPLCVALAGLVAARLRRRQGA